MHRHRRGHLPLGRHLLVPHDLLELFENLEFEKLATTDLLGILLVDLVQDLQLALDLVQDLALDLVQNHTLEGDKDTDPSCKGTGNLRDSPLELGVGKLVLRHSGGRV